jgi:hypothetical protein
MIAINTQAGVVVHQYLVNSGVPLAVLLDQAPGVWVFQLEPGHVLVAAVCGTPQEAVGQAMERWTPEHWVIIPAVLDDWGTVEFWHLRAERTPP